MTATAAARSISFGVAFTLALASAQAAPRGFEQGKKNGWSSGLESLTVRTVVANCGGDAPWELYLNDVRVASAAIPWGCYCENSNLETLAVTDPALLAGWKGDGTDVLQVRFNQHGIAVGYLLVTLEGAGEALDYCAFDEYGAWWWGPGGDCAQRPLCAGYRWYGDWGWSGSGETITLPAFAPLRPPGWAAGAKAGWDGTRPPGLSEDHGGGNGGHASLLGCADGSREGLADPVRYPAIAACGGQFSGFIDEAPAQSLCATGWHVCRGTDQVLWPMTFAEATAFAGCFAYDSAHDCGSCFNTCRGASSDGGYSQGRLGCYPSDPTWDNDMAGMGAGCNQYPGQSSCLADWRVDASTNEFGCMWGPRLTGVVCCRDVP